MCKYDNFTVYVHTAYRYTVFDVQLKKYVYNMYMYCIFCAWITVQHHTVMYVFYTFCTSTIGYIYYVRMYSTLCMYTYLQKFSSANNSHTSRYLKWGSMLTIVKRLQIQQLHIFCHSAETCIILDTTVESTITMVMVQFTT
jgi:hypothetical protein